MSLQRRCSNNLNQVAIQANTYGGIYPEEIKTLQRDYEKLWRPLSDLLEKLSAIVRLLTCRKIYKAALLLSTPSNSRAAQVNLPIVE